MRGFLIGLACGAFVGAFVGVTIMDDPFGTFQEPTNTQHPDMRRVDGSLNGSEDVLPIRNDTNADMQRTFDSEVNAVAR